MKKRQKKKMKKAEAKKAEIGKGQSSSIAEDSQSAATKHSHDVSIFNDVLVIRAIIS